MERANLESSPIQPGIPIVLPLTTIPVRMPMRLSPKLKESSLWFPCGLLVLWLFSLALRFWGLGRFNTLVFDEVYYVKFAHNYLTQTPFFDGHPPLSKYLIAIGIWFGNQLPIGREAVNTMAGAAYSTWSYRWLNALTGSLIPLVVSAIAWQLTRSHRYALLAGLLSALDGLFLVESRYALNNIYLIIFGLLGLWLLLLAVGSAKPWLREFWLVLAGICFGASVAIKWNGLWFLLGAIGLWITVWLIKGLQALRPRVAALFPLQGSGDNQNPLAQLARLSWWQIGLNLLVVPAIFYRLSWIPHLQMNPGSDFWQLQNEILSYHERVGSGPKVHPYCSSWYTWLTMIRPVAYFYQVTDRGAPLPSGQATATGADTVIYDVHAIGNPILWWFSTLAILLVLVALIQGVLTWATSEPATDLPGTLPPTMAELEFSLTPGERWLGLFLLVNYAANLLPWVRVTRCVFLYHYMGASVFSLLALAWLLDRWLSSTELNLRVIAINILLMTIFGFIFWLPIYLGLPLSPLEFKLRIWLPSWL